MVMSTGPLFTSAELIDNKQIEAFQHALAQSVIGIVGKDDRGEFGKQVGTGTLVDHDGNRCILTPEHVIRGCTSDELQFLLPTEGIRIRQYGEPVDLRLGEIIKREPLSLRAIRHDSVLDVAILVLAESATVPDHWTFRKLRKLAAAVPIGAHAMMMGYPAQRAVPYVDGNLIGIRNFDYPEVMDIGSYRLNDFDPNLHYLVDFPSAAEFHPGGYSGSGIWFKEASSELGTDGLWFSDPRYAGMVLSYYERVQLLKILHVNAILDFLQKP